MKSLILIYVITLSTYLNAYTFLVNKYDKEIELESKIISKIAKSSLTQEIILFIPDMTKNEKSIYSKIFTLTNKCEEANFVYTKKETEKENLCDDKKRLYFTNNYRKLLSNEKYFGAFFWSKSRPNIVFVKHRLEKYNITLPQSYLQFIEDL